MVSITCHSQEATGRLAEFMAPLLQDGDVLALSGDLGAGKTFFVQKITEALGLDEAATSPTFTLLQVYEGKIPIHHFDLYRLEAADQLEDIGFYEYTTYGISFIEWPDQFRDCLPLAYLWLTIRRGDGPEERIFTFEGVGARYEQMCEELKNFDHSCP